MENCLPLENIDDWDDSEDQEQSSANSSNVLPLFDMASLESEVISKREDMCTEHTLEELDDWDIKIDDDCFIQWNDAVKKGNITPENSIEKDELNNYDEMEEDAIIIFQTKSETFNDVLFSHQIHTYWLGCNGCHYGRRIFIPLEGANPITMKKISEGEYCGVCHSSSAKTDAFHITSNEKCWKCHLLKKRTETLFPAYLMKKKKK